MNSLEISNVNLSPVQLDNNNSLELTSNSSTVTEEKTSDGAGIHLKINQKNLAKIFSYFSYEGNKDAQGWALDSIGRSMVVGPAIFLGTTLLKLANEAAGCYGDSNSDISEKCDKRVYGIKPSSFLAVYTVVLGLMSTLIMPFFGSIIDHTNYRRAVGRKSAAAISIFSFLSIFISKENWFTILILQIFSGFFFYVHTMVSILDKSIIFGEVKVTAGSFCVPS